MPVGSDRHLWHGADSRFDKIGDERSEPVTRPFVNPGPGWLLGASAWRIIAGGAAAGVDGRLQRRQWLEGNRLVRMFGIHRAGTFLVRGF